MDFTKEKNILNIKTQIHASQFFGSGFFFRKVENRCGSRFFVWPMVLSWEKSLQCPLQSQSKKCSWKAWKVSPKKEKRLTEQQQPKNSRKQQVQYKWFLKVTHFRKSTLQLKLLLSMRKWICCVFPTQGSYFGFGVKGTISFQSFSILSFCSPISSWHRGVTALGEKTLVHSLGRNLANTSWCG